FNYAEHPLILFRFYQRFAQLTLAQRGRDPRISIPTKAQGRKARHAFTRYAPGCWRGEALVSVREQMSVTQLALLRLTVSSGDEKQVFIIGAPRWYQGGYSPFGRATHHGMAYCELEEETFFYKDYWREDAPHTIPESEVYHLLAEHEVPHVNHWNRLKPQSSSFHVLLMLWKVCRSTLLSYSLNDPEWLTAHQKAHELVGILHRDISTWNIMMTLNRENRRGILIDWDHCVLVNKFHDSARISRMGTWQFVSAYLIESLTAEHTFVNDRESALYVLVWIALCHLQHSLSA
ncbi:hypothetical protein EDD18DRAFT_1403267, partial [Armillaria luteobubalina]